MSQGSLDLLKVLAVTALTFAVGTLVMLYVTLLLSRYGASLPLISALPLRAPPDMVPLLADNRLFTTLAAVHITASGLALLIASNTIDMGLLILSKAVTVVIIALLGIVGGHMAYLQITEGHVFALSPLTPVLIVLVGFWVLSTVLSVPTLRQLGNLRFLVAIAMVLAGPLVLALL